MSAGLVVRGLSAGYGGIRVLDGVSLEAPEGELTVVVGSNGAGKTTLLRALSGMIPRSGEVLFGGAPLPATPSAIVSRGLAQVPEGRQLFPQMTVRENLELGGYLLARGEREARLARVLELFPKLAERRGQLAGTMSGGEQQMLAVGRALMGKPKLLMLDEPSLGLAPRMVDELLAIVRRIRQDGVTILLVEQNVAKALAIASGAYVIERGAVVMKGPAGKLLRSERLRAAYLGAEAKPGALNWKGGIFMSKEQTTAVTIAAENAWKGKIFTGRWQLAKGGAREVLEPATGKVLTEVGFADAEDVAEAAKSAAAAQPEWAAASAEQRAAVLRRAAQLLEAHADALRPWIVRESGSIPPKADFELHMVSGILLEAAAIAT
ncbi:MAG: aldehyde dehydrogenase family protein, partial [Betaproteobacteria bacterium]|nr:aldehyde dehydrogenase family protein [Betaproteobacteria bacterium]